MPALSIVFNSILLVFASEMGDKTQLLALVLASRFKRPWTIMAGILTATVLNHGLASVLGTWLASLISAQVLAIVLALIFIAFGLWILVPDKEGELHASSGRGAFLTTVVSFFLAEMGDKTQLATVALAAKYSAPLLVTSGTTIGMLLADGLAVFLGERLTAKIPLKWIRRLACGLFVLFGVLIAVRGLNP